MTTPSYASMVQALYDYLTRLLTDPDAQAEYLDDPEGALDREGLGDANGEDVYDAACMLADKLPYEARSHFEQNYVKQLSGATSNVNVTQTGAAPPPPPLGSGGSGGGGGGGGPDWGGPGGGAGGGDHGGAVQHLTYLTKNFSEITNHTVDNSLTQYLHAGGDINQALATGEGSFANTGEVEGAVNTGDVSGIMAGGDVQGAAVGEGNTVFGGDTQGAAVGDGNTVIGGDAGNVNVGGEQTNVEAGGNAIIGDHNIGGDQTNVDASSAFGDGGNVNVNFGEGDQTSVADSDLQGSAVGGGTGVNTEVGDGGIGQVATGGINEQDADITEAQPTFFAGDEPHYGEADAEAYEPPVANGGSAPDGGEGEGVAEGEPVV